MGVVGLVDDGILFSPRKEAHTRKKEENIQLIIIKKHGTIAIV